MAYVADLDAIAGRGPDWQAVAAIADAGLSVVVDAGCADLERARDLAEFRSASGALAGIVVGSESVVAEHTLPTLVQTIGADRAVFSLDLHAGHVLAAAESLRGKSPAEIADTVFQAGFRRIIVLDLTGVGVARGPVTIETCYSLRAQHDWCELISGGGVRQADDLRALEHAGCNAALIATALHDGSLGREDMAPWCTV
jgi:phosphoribosylformimino-5-aminoimidazole carboxamide ribotide isomerase